ncbi:unnamed protein product [Mytilus edulis]|uniref:DZIP3-like HEPN domain-containing protein n=1 Tax=Mytilus edulis TaxID=6550 RepID=A0A8S3RJN5_MYTED|nr:unnamed protein product [Mytilus edulis]
MVCFLPCKCGIPLIIISRNWLKHHDEFKSFVLTDVPNSDTFDITLIITLLRNLADLIPPHGGYDRLPSAIETTPGSDLARIKYYRNYLAHLDDAKIDNTFSTLPGKTLAIYRLAGSSMKHQCDQLKTKVLDQTNKDIILEIRYSRNEIQELKQSLENLKIIHEENESKNDTTRQVLLTEIEKLKAEQEELFKEHQRASDYVIACLEDNKCVTITAPPGLGKSFIARHTALVLKMGGYNIIPVSSPTDIRDYYQPGRLAVFIVDDICGNFTANQQQIENWKQLFPVIKTILQTIVVRLSLNLSLQVCIYACANNFHFISSESSECESSGDEFIQPRNRNIKRLKLDKPKKFQINAMFVEKTTKI